MEEKQREESAPEGPQDKQRRISDIIPRVADDGARTSRRFALEASVTFLQPSRVTGVAIDANATGMRVALDSPLDVGIRCIAVVELADGGETHERAEVVWAEPKDDGWVVGLRFAG